MRDRRWYNLYEIILAISAVAMMVAVISLLLTPPVISSADVVPAVSNTTLATDSEHSVSVPPLTNTTDVAVAGWKTAEVNLDGKKFKVFYIRQETRKFDWGSKQQASVIYHLKDEATVSGTPPGDYGFYVFLGIYGGTFLVEKERLDQAHYQPDSLLQEIILNNQEEEGKKIFRQIFDGLEVIEAPKK